jgi:heme/copper-type cytochrome/quinol oxidase subunit 1
MHSLVRRYIKTAILFLAVGLALGAWLIVRRELGGHTPAPYLVSAHTHSILVGFMMMMILGVALWVFPRPDRENARYRPAVAEVAYYLITVGTAARTGGEILRDTRSDGWLRVTVALGAALQVVGLALFFYTMWNRIRSAGSRQREMQGERF